MKYPTKEALASAAVDQAVRTGLPLRVAAVDVSPKLRGMGACFVTIYLDGKLHGCIGTIEARQPLHRDIGENALGAALRDWRFLPLKTEDLGRLSVEVSVLKPLKPYVPVSEAALLQELERDKPGLVVEKDGQRAVFLPQVWEQLPTAEIFLQELCRKAGLGPTAWREGMRFQVFGIDP